MRLVYSRIKAILAWLIYKNRSKKLIVIWITGTDGKTTTSHFIAQFLEQFWEKVGLISGQEYRIHKNKWKNSSKRTTPSPFFVRNFCKKCVKADCKYLVIETSSHALHQRRVFGISYNIALITNLSQEHTDYHGSMLWYAKAKARLFRMVANNTYQTQKAIIPAGIPYEDLFVYPLWQNNIFVSADINNASDSMYSIKNIKNNLDGVSASLWYSNQNIIDTKDFCFSFLWSHMATNALFACIVCHQLGFNLTALQNSWSQLYLLPWRLQKLATWTNLNVFIDFAVTAKALEATITTLTNTKNQDNNLRLVFGCTGGNHDKDKRPLMWEVSLQADKVIFTEDESYGEDFYQIYKQTFPQNKQEITVIHDREEAIHFALKNAKVNDFVVVCGMGDLESRNIWWKEQQRSDTKIIKNFITTISHK